MPGYRAEPFHPCTEERTSEHDCPPKFSSQMTYVLGRQHIRAGHGLLLSHSKPISPTEAPNSVHSGVQADLQTASGKHLSEAQAPQDTSVGLRTVAEAARSAMSRDTSAV